MKKEIKEKYNQEDLWDWICSQVGFDKEGKEIQQAIRLFLAQEKQKERKRAIEMLKRIKLEVDVCVCDCGEKWIETDLADIVNAYLKELK